MGSVIFNVLKWTLLLAFVTAISTGIYLPVYSDEIAVKFIYSRFFIDGPERLNLFPQCSGFSSDHLAWVFYPASILLSIFYQELDPIGIRISGLVICFFWFGFVSYWCYKQNNELWLNKFSLMIVFAALGVLPYLWVMSRTEQIMIIPLILLSFYSCNNIEFSGRLNKIAYLMLIYTSISVFFFVHPKSIFFTPFIALSAWLASRKFNYITRILTVLFALLSAYQVFIDAGFISSCNDAPKLKTLLTSYTLPVGLLLVNPELFFDLAWSNIIKFPDRMLVHLVFNPTYQSGWLPPINSLQIFETLNHLISITIKIFLLSTHTGVLLVSIIIFYNKKNDTIIHLASLLSIANITNAAFYVNQSFYDGMLYIFASIIITIMIFDYIYRKHYIFHEIRLYYLLSPIYALSLVSLTILIYNFLPLIKNNSSIDTSTILDQPTSIPIHSYDEQFAEIKALGRICNLPENNSENLVLDHSTYFAFIENKKPIHILYTGTEYFGADLVNGNLIPFLKDRKSPGIITRCQWLPIEFDKNVKSSDSGYCCINLSDY